MYRPGELVISEEGVTVRQKGWNEILEALEKVRPDIKSIVASCGEA